MNLTVSIEIIMALFDVITDILNLKNFLDNNQVFYFFFLLSFLIFERIIQCLFCMKVGPKNFKKKFLLVLGTVFYLD